MVSTENKLIAGSGALILGGFATYESPNFLDIAHQNAYAFQEAGVLLMASGLLVGALSAGLRIYNEMPLARPLTSPQIIAQSPTLARMRIAMLQKSGQRALR